MQSKNKLVIINFFRELLELYEFELYITTNSENEKVFKLKDLQGGNLGEIENDTFLTLADVLERLEIYHNDYIYQPLENRESNSEIIPKDDWDLTAKRYIESDVIIKILSDISATEYEKIQEYLPNFSKEEIIEILNKEEQFCKTICQKYINTMSKEILLEKENKIFHIYIQDEYIELKEKITVDNYKDYLDNNFDVYEYSSYKELFDNTIRNEIAYDLNDLELFNEKGEWNFYITFEELKQIGYGFMVKDQFPLIEKYAVSEDKIFDFFNYFSLEQLDDFEESLNQYFNEKSIVYNEDSYEGFESKESVSFNKDILRLACGLITYEDFIANYTEHPIPYYDLSLSKVIEYFKENEMKDLMEYGSDKDEGLYHLSSMYKEILDKLNIKYSNIYTEDGASDGKYITIITFENNSKIEIDTSAWNGIKTVAKNIESIYENFKKSQEKIAQLKKNTQEIGDKSGKEIDYDYE